MNRRLSRREEGCGGKEAAGRERNINWKNKESWLLAKF
jgi:hypothetical protein